MRRSRSAEMRWKRSTIGTAEGSIIAAIIVTHTPRYQPSPPRSVPGPASIPRIRCTVTIHVISVAPINAAPSGRALRPLSQGRPGPSGEGRPTLGGLSVKVGKPLSGPWPAHPA